MGKLIVPTENWMRPAVRKWSVASSAITSLSGSVEPPARSIAGCAVGVFPEGTGGGLRAYSNHRDRHLLVMPLHGRLHADMADAGDDHVGMRCNIGSGRPPCRLKDCVSTDFYARK
jgi:hypothetical protein